MQVGDKILCMHGVDVGTGASPAPERPAWSELTRGKAEGEHELTPEDIDRLQAKAREYERGEQTAPLRAELGKLEVEAADLERRMTALSEAITTREEATGHNEHYPEESSFLFEMDHEPGQIGGVAVDEETARVTPCHKFQLNDGPLVFSKGVIGPLDEGQQALYCPQIVDVPLTEAQRKRYEAFKGAVTTCQTEIKDTPKGERLTPWLKCMSRETKAKGVEI